MNALSISTRLASRSRPTSSLAWLRLLARDGVLAGLAGSLAMTASAVLLAAAYGSNAWLPLKTIGTLVLGPAAAAQAGFVAAPVLAGLLIQLAVSALLGMLFVLITRSVWQLPSDLGVPAVSGLMFGLLVWLAGYLTLPVWLPELMVVVLPAFIMQYIAFGTTLSLVYARLRPQPYASTR
jgi:hypothetical protein